MALASQRYQAIWTLLVNASQGIQTCQINFIGKTYYFDISQLSHTPEAGLSQINEYFQRN